MGEAKGDRELASGKGKTAGEKGKALRSEFAMDLTRDSDRAHARTHDAKQNDFPVGLSAKGFPRFPRTSELVV